MKKKRKKIEFSKDFFQVARPTISNEETFKDVIPIKWEKRVASKKKKVIVYSSKEEKVL